MQVAKRIQVLTNWALWCCCFKNT